MVDEGEMSSSGGAVAEAGDGQACASVSNLVPALVRGLRLMQVFSTARPKWAMSELVAYLDAPRSTVARLVRSLASLGFLVEDEAGRLSPGPAVLGIGTSFLDGASVVRVAAPVLRELANRTLAAAQWLALDGMQAVVIAQALPDDPGGACAATRVGARFAIGGTGFCGGQFGDVARGVRSACGGDAAVWTYGEAIVGGAHAEAAALPLMAVPILRDGRVRYALSVGVQADWDAASTVERARLSLEESAQRMVRALSDVGEGR